MQDTIYCFHFLARRQKRTLLYILCSIPAIATVWLLNPEWPFWAGYIAWAIICTAALAVLYAAPLPIRCPHCGYSRLHPATQTPEEQRRPDTGIMLTCRSCASPSTRTPIFPGREKASAAVPFPRTNGMNNLPIRKPGLFPPERETGRTSFPES